MYDELIEILQHISKLLQIKGDSFFKFSAYTNAADTLKESNYDLEELVKKDELKNLKGFGKALTDKVTDYVLNGKMEYYEKLKSEFPLSLLEIEKINGMGPKRINKIYTELGVKNIAELDSACKNGTILKVAGFSDKIVEEIQKSITEYYLNDNYKDREIDFTEIQ